MKPIARYARVSKQEQAKDSDALVRQLFQLEEAVKDMGIDPDPKYLFTDIQSGRKDDRPQFEQLLELIRQKAISRVVIVRIDRITRDLEMNARLAKLLERTKVEIFEILLGRCINFNNPQDWEYFATSGVRAEGESRMLSVRTKAGKKFLRFQGKTQGGRLPFGYKRSEKGFYEPDLERWDAAKRMIEIFLECRSSVTAVRLIYEETGAKMTYQGLNRWLRNETLRGHTPYIRGEDRDRAHNRRKATEIRYNTHEALISPDVAELIDSILEDNRRNRGRNRKNKIYPLSGLIFCAQCGASATVTTQVENQAWSNVYCSAYRKGLTGQGCGDRKKIEAKGKKGKVGVRYSSVEAEVIRVLCERAEQLAETAIESLEFMDDVPSEEELRLERQIGQIEQLIREMGDESGLLRQKIDELKAKRPTRDIESDVSELKKILVIGGSNPDSWNQLDPIDRKILFRKLVSRVLVNRETRAISVELNL